MECDRSELVQLAVSLDLQEASTLMSFWKKWVATVVLVVWAVLVSCSLWGQGLDASLEGAARRFASEERRISGQLSRSAAPYLKQPSPPCATPPIVPHGFFMRRANPLLCSINLRQEQNQLTSSVICQILVGVDQAGFRLRLVIQAEFIA